ncbi:MAG TPA: hypothetical protein VN317_09690, partial [Candidatus Methanoperedens sp.]|nr:hypothetical protein [Candidatus Methanoperedens sp.]
MRAVAVALLGAGLGIFAVSLSGALASFFWPLAAHGVLRGALVAGGIAALAAAAAPPSWRALLGRHRALLAATGLAAAAVAALATQPLARVLHPGAGLGLRSFPLVYLATLALPFAAAGIALVTWCDERAGRRLGLFIAGIGAGVL